MMNILFLCEYPKCKLSIPIQFVGLEGNSYVVFYKKNNFRYDLYSIMGKRGLAGVFLLTTDR
jgi:hypothetical protein